MSLVNSGSTAHIAYRVLGKHLDSLEIEALSQIKLQFRQGDFDQVKMLVKIAQLCNLEDIKAKLLAEINRGETAGKELTENVD